MFSREKSQSSMIVKSIIAAILGLFVGGVFILFTEASPLQAFYTLVQSAFGCGKNGHCAIWTTLQYATPLIFSGLSAAVAFRAGVFSIGQAGQMLMGAGIANWMAYHSGIPEVIHPVYALAGASFIGALYGSIPGILKTTLGVNEIIVTIVMNSIAAYLVGIVPAGWGRSFPEAARLAPLVAGTKLNSGFILSLGALLGVYLLLWRTPFGYAIRMSGQAPRFAKAGGINTKRSIVLAMAISGALAGMAGGIEVLGVHYRLVSNFSGSDNFDGLVVALLGQSHPIGMLIAAIFLGGIRLGAMTGLSIQLGVPRSLGGIMIATMVIIMGADHVYDINIERARRVFRLAI